jgi:hypothetical protein
MNYKVILLSLFATLSLGSARVFAEEAAAAPATAAAPEGQQTAQPTAAPAEASAAPSDSDTGRHWYLSGIGNFDYTSTTAATGASAPSMVTEGLGFLATYRITPRWMAGLSTDYKMINQTNDPGTSGTNFSGTRFNVLSPTVGAFFGKHLLLLDYEMMGNWTLTKSASNGGTAAYKNPTGFRVRYFHPLGWRSLNIGAEFESLSFSTLNNSISGDTTLTTTQALTQFGVLLSYTL